MSPLEELQADGRLGPEGARLLYRVVRTIVVGHGFPPPGDRPAWNGEAVAETAHEFLADERTPKRLAHLLVHALDDDSFSRILHRMVLNFLRDGGRRTEIGRLMLRLRDVLGGSDEFVAEPGDCWRLEKQPATPSTAAPAVLVEAAATERHVDVPRWSAQTRRRAPAADAASLERLCRRVLEAAAGTVALDQLAQAIAPRLGLTPTPLAQSPDDRDPFERIAGPQHADAVLDSLRATEIFTILSRRERLLLASAGTPVRELRSVIGVGPSQAAELQARLRALLAAELQDDEGYEAVFFHLVDQAKAWARQQKEYQQSTGQPDAIERLMKRDMTNEHEAPVDDPTESQLADLVRAAAAVAVPDGVRAAVAAADRPEAGPQAGELWRARRGGGSVTLVWLRSLTATGAVAMPVSFDTEMADEDTLIVPGDASPLGLPLVLHRAAETTIDRNSLLDRLGSLDPAAVQAAPTGPPAELLRLEDGSAVAHDRDADADWWPLDTASARADLLKAIHQSLSESHPGARIAPRPAATAGSEHLSAVALVAELDAFVLVAVIDHPLDDAARLEAARQVLHADQLLNAVCLAEPAAPFLSVVIDRRDVVAAIETPSGQLRPPRQSRPPAPVATALSKFLDATISPFGRLARTFVEGQALDPRALAVDVSADAVRTVEGSAKTFKTEGKRPGYERVKRHQASITRLVEEALNQPDVDVASILDEDDR